MLVEEEVVVMRVVRVVVVVGWEVVVGAGGEFVGLTEPGAVGVPVAVWVVDTWEAVAEIPGRMAGPGMG